MFHSVEGRLFPSHLDTWKSKGLVQENIECEETHIPVLVLSNASSSVGERGLLSWGFIKTLETIYSHSLSLSLLLMHLKAIFLVNKSTTGPSFEFGLSMDQSAPLGRIFALPI